MPPAPLAAAARSLVNHLAGAVRRQLRYADTLAVAFSGDLSSLVLARLLAEHADVPVYLVTVARPGARDAPRARQAARHLRLTHVEVVLTPARLHDHLATLVRLVGRTPAPPERAQEANLPVGSLRLSPPVVAVAGTLFLAAEEARLHARRLILDQGADELFAGPERPEAAPEADLPAPLGRDLEFYERHVQPAEQRIADHFGLQFRYPYLDAGVRRWAQRLPNSIERGADGSRRGVLREAARLLGLPAALLDAPESAAQQGNGTTQLLRELAAGAGRPLEGFLEQFLSPTADSA